MFTVLNLTLSTKGTVFRKSKVSEIFETRHGHEKSVAPEALGPFPDAVACVPTEDIDFNKQEYRVRPIDFPSMNFGSFHRLSRRLSPTGGYILQFI